MALYISHIMSSREIDRVYKASEGSGKCSEIVKLSIESFVALSRAREIAEKGANYTPTISAVRNRMAMIAEHYSEFQDPVAASCICFQLQKPYICSGYFSDIDTLLLWGAVSMSVVKIAAIESRAIRVDGSCAAIHIEGRCGNIPRNIVAHKPSSTTAQSW